MTCHCASLADTTARFFDERRVRSELAAYRRVGPRVTTQGLLGELAATGPAPETLLDGGSGIGAGGLPPPGPAPEPLLAGGAGSGALTLGLLRAGVRHAVCVDMSRASLAAS